MVSQLARKWWVVAVRGLAAILFGLAAFFWPGITLAALVILFGAYAFVDGIFAIVSAVQSATEHERWGTLLLEGIAGMVAGLLTFFLPAITAVALLFVMAAWAIVTGVLEIAAAIRLRKEIDNEWLLALSGIASLIFGLVLLIHPLAGALAVVWVIGSYAIVFGGVMVALGFRLRKLAPPAEQAQTRATV